jgi:hypothetical protein
VTPGLTLDHLAVAGETLEAAAEAVETALGIALAAGGAHDTFGTHNRLIGLEDGLYLEAIAIDPEASPPKRPRWFDLDRFAGAPRLTNWICRTEDLDALLAALPAGAGKPVSLTRGAFRWRMAVPETGRLPFDNLFPALIEWQGDLHPAPLLPVSRCALRRLVVAHPEALALRDHLAVSLDDERLVFEPGDASLLAEFDTPHGRRILR